jgi:hypothetical protein
MFVLAVFFFPCFCVSVSLELNRVVFYHPCFLVIHVVSFSFGCKSTPCAVCFAQYILFTFAFQKKKNFQITFEI